MGLEFELLNVGNPCMSGVLVCVSPVVAGTVYSGDGGSVGEQVGGAERAGE